MNTTSPYDSMYEMDAPQLVDFDEMNVSVNESIFDRRTVGEKVPRPFRDIGNVTPTFNRVLKDSGVGKTPDRTPNNQVSMLLETSTRRITRSAARQLEQTITPTINTNTASPALADVKSLIKADQQELVVNMETVCSSEEVNLCHPTSVTHSPPPSLCANVTVPSKRNSVKMELKLATTFRPTRASAGSLDTVERGASNSSALCTQPRPGKDSARTRSISKSKLPMKPAHSGTPFKGKSSPLKTLRARTRSMENGASGSRSGAAGKESNKPTEFRHTLRQRTASAGDNPAAGKPSSRFQSKVVRKVPGASTTSLSPTLSRLMKPTESVRQKMHAVKSSPSPSKRKTSSSSESRPPKALKSTIPKSPSFLRQSRSRLTPAKSSEDLEMERVKKEKEELLSLRKKNQEGLKNISSNGKTRPSGLPAGRPTSADAKAKRNIYDAVKTAQQPDNDKPLQFRESGSSSRRDAYNMRPRLTKPLSPKLLSKSRERTAPTRTEDVELAMIKQAQFKATPLDKRVLEGQTGVKLVERQPVTAPLPVKFATDERLAKHAEKHVGQAVAPEPQPVIKALPPPKPKAVFKPKLDHKTTDVAPFTFESKDEAARLRREELLKRVEEEERKLREFKAQPLPPSPAPLPSKQVVSVTKPEPFRLMIDERGQQHQEKLKKKLEEEHSRMLEATMVRAKPADVLKKAPFVLKKEPPKVTEPLRVELNSTKRAEERKEFEQRKMEASAQCRELEEQMQKRQAAEERREMIRLRQETIIKPAPIKHYKPVQIQRSEKPLTMPMSPRFAKK